jgi:inhibitor of cysteine peptidase
MSKNKLSIIGILFIFSVISSLSFANRIKEYTRLDIPIEIYVGDEFVITLDSNRTTGYQWKFAGPLDYGMLEFIRSEYIVHSKTQPGRGGRERWHFRATDTGVTLVILKYVRPWEKDQRPAKTAVFKVIVR